MFWYQKIELVLSISLTFSIFITILNLPLLLAQTTSWQQCQGRLHVQLHQSCFTSGVYIGFAVILCLFCYKNKEKTTKQRKNWKTQSGQVFCISVMQRNAERETQRKKEQIWDAEIRRIATQSVKRIAPWPPTPLRTLRDSPLVRLRVLSIFRDFSLP